MGIGLKKPTENAIVPKAEHKPREIGMFPHCVKHWMYVMMKYCI